MSPATVFDAGRARPYRALTVEDLRVLLDGHDPQSPVLFEDRWLGLVAIRNAEIRALPRRTGDSQAASTGAAFNADRALVLASPLANDAAPGVVVVTRPLARLVHLLALSWARVGAFGAANVQRNYHRLDHESDEGSVDIS